MIRNDSGENIRELPARLWRFADFELDELRRELRVRGNPVELESKPFEVLVALLQHAGEVVTKEELLEAVWPGTMVVDGSLATAVSKLRKAMGDDDQLTVLTVPRVGYRLAVSVQSKALAGGVWAELGLQAGDTVPGREHWRLTRKLDLSGSSEVWLAQNPKTHEVRVFKFATDGVQLKGLKREVTLARFLRESLGERQDFARVLEWNFEAPPFFLESEYGGANLAEWAESEGGLIKIPRELRLCVLVDIAKAVAAAHDIGVLHKDLKPANVLIALASEGRIQVKVADFGSGTLMDPGRLGALGITNLGFTQTSTPDSILTGTLTYIAPEVLAGQSPTASADVYALGVILFQLMVGDFRKPLSPGWEAEIDDPLIRADIAEAACGDPERRLKSAAELVERLENLESRRIERDKIKLAEQRALIAERKLAESRTRRPWIAVAIVTLLIGLGTSLVLYRRALHARDNANRQTEIANAVNRFLSNDLLGRSNPFKTGKADESLSDAVKQASPGIDRQFANEPQVAAHLHQTIGRALDLRTDYAGSRQEYERAATLFTQSDGPLSQDAIIVQLQRAALEARSYQAGTLELAKSILAEQESKISKIPQTRGDLLVWLSTARGMIALIGNNAQAAKDNFKAASDKAATVPAIDENTRLALKQRLAFTDIRLGNGIEAERLFRELIAAYSQNSGPDSADVLRVRLNLAQAFMIQNKNAEAIEEANQIYPAFVAKLGRDHEITMQVLATRAQCEGTLGRWEDAIRDGLEVHQLAVQKQGPLSFFAIGSLSDASLAQCRGGHLIEGEANARSAYEASRKAFGERAGLTGGTADTLADCLIERNKLDEAAKLLDNIDIKSVAQLTGIPDWSANIDLARAEIASRRGDYTTAQKNIQPAIPVFSRADAEPYQKHKLDNLLTSINNHVPHAQ
ncbi:MAG TPA: tetratricopeptide repeat protein [Terriglobales bacterium]|nr:tetratricopeptide repeat protein [Terriglobales bacterium]